MEKARRSAANSLRGAKTLSALTGYASNGLLTHGDSQLASGFQTEYNRAKPQSQLEMIEHHLLLLSGSITPELY
jgi:hypothetical protein